jgi:hypothetical protein
MYAFLKCLGQAFLKHGLKVVVSPVPFLLPAYEMAMDAWTNYRQGRNVEDLRVELKDSVHSEGKRLEQVIAEVVEEVAVGQPHEDQQLLTVYLKQVPDSIRHSFRRQSSDPTGRTVPGELRLDSENDLIPLLPARLPRFKRGDRPRGIGDWELEDLLGTGGYGEVWKARNPYRGDTVAL